MVGKHQAQRQTAAPAPQDGLGKVRGCRQRPGGPDGDGSSETPPGEPSTPIPHSTGLAPLGPGPQCSLCSGHPPRLPSPFSNTADSPAPPRSGILTSKNLPCPVPPPRVWNPSRLPWVPTRPGPAPSPHPTAFLPLGWHGPSWVCSSYWTPSS